MWVSRNISGQERFTGVDEQEQIFGALLDYPIDAVSTNVFEITIASTGKSHVLARSPGEQKALR